MRGVKTMITTYAKYSVVLKTLMENESSKTALEKALSTYPLYSNEKAYDLIPTREQLNEKLLNHYKYREIGFETPGRFIDELKITMCEIMPYYNELFKTIVTMAELENPFDNVDVIEKFEETRTGNSTTNGSTSSTGTSVNTNEATGNQTSSGSGTLSGNDSKKTKFSDTPQNSIGNIDNYLSNYTEETDINMQQSSDSNTTSGTSSGTSESESSDSSTTEGKTQSSGTTTHTYTKKGNQGVNTYAHDMNEFRTSIIDVVERIITDKRIADLFMLVW